MKNLAKNLVIYIPIASLVANIVFFYMFASGFALIHLPTTIADAGGNGRPGTIFDGQPTGGGILCFSETVSAETASNICNMEARSRNDFLTDDGTGWTNSKYNYTFAVFRK